jgi:hypothetical protein
MKLQLHYHGHEQFFLKKNQINSRLWHQKFCTVDDIAALMDDVVVMSKINQKKQQDIR